MLNLKNEFPILNHYTYLNTPFTGVLSSTVHDKITALEEEYRQHGSDFMDRLEHDIISSTKLLLSEIFNADPEHIGILNNFSTGLNLILNDMPEDAKVILLAQDYPSVNLPVKSRAFKITEVEIDLKIYENLKSVFHYQNPDFFIFSMTQFVSGFQMDLDILRQLKSEFPHICFIADATQYCGTEAFDFENSPFDVFGTSGYKWLNAGLGNAFFLMKPSFVDKFHFKTIGSNSLTSKPDGKPKPSGFLEPGHHDILAIARLKFALEFHYKTLGIDFIETSIKTISAQAKSRLLDLNLLDKTLNDSTSHQHIFSLEGDDNFVQKLKDQGILTSFRGGRIRVGFQYYNTQDHLDLLTKAFKK